MSISTPGLAALRQRVGERESAADMRQRINTSLRDVLRPAKAKAQANIRTAPSRSGRGRLRSAIARSVSVRVERTGAAIETKPVAGFRSAPRSFDARSFRHPVFGNRRVWVTQVGRPGWWSEPIIPAMREARQAMSDILTDTTRDIA